MILKISNCLQLLTRFLVTFVFIAFFTNQANAEDKWELGMGLGHLTSHAYMGSSEQVTLTTPVPFIKLQTDWFDLSEGSLKMNWFEDTPFRLSFNFDVGLPVESKDVELRQGMDDLDPIVQVGPMITYHLENVGNVEWKIEAPVLFAYSADGADLDSTGWTFTPRIAMRFQINNAKSPLDLEMSLGPVYSAKKYHQYYYSVASNDVNTDRGFYQSDGGFAGYRLNMSFTKRVDDLWFGLYLRYHNLSDAEFRDSPLVEQDEFWLVTFAASWIFTSNY